MNRISYFWHFNPKRMKPIEKPMFYGAGPKTFEKAKALRGKMTPSEIILWDHLKNNQFGDVRFRRQHPISIFIVDFYCHSAKLVIELDGKIHNQKDNKIWDQGRTAELEKFGLKVIRFTNEQVINDIECVLEEIKKHL